LQATLPPRYRASDRAEHPALAYVVDEENPAEQIPQLEAEIERLARVAESCRKVILAAKVAIALAALVLVVTIAGLVRFDQLVMLGAIAAILGGIAAAGSNSTTLREACENMRAAEARRAELIGALPFSAVIEE
jgi:TRAP-type mannitol/chloroaromatic compound transport system permease large subunit